MQLYSCNMGVKPAPRKSVLWEGTGRNKCNPKKSRAHNFSQQMCVFPCCDSHLASSWMDFFTQQKGLQMFKGAIGVSGPLIRGIGTGENGVKFGGITFFRQIFMSAFVRLHIFPMTFPKLLPTWSPFLTLDFGNPFPPILTNLMFLKKTSQKKLCRK